MTNVKWWKVGFVRIVAICIMAISIHGISYNIERHSLVDFSRFSGPTAMIGLLIGLALFIVGFRTERDYEKVSRITNS